MQEEKFLTVGIDIGTSTSQLVISRMTVQNYASVFSVPRIVISNKEVLHRSDIIFTPIIGNDEIDVNPLKRFISDEYLKNGIDKSEIQMGAVIITGETARKKNAALVLEALSDYAGDFVVATAGPDLESIIAGKGAGTEKLSKERKGPIVNIDIGGGTSNLVAFKNGDILSTGCFDIGGRLIKVDSETQIITYISPKIINVLSSLNIELTVGQMASIDKLMCIIDELVKVLENSVGIGPKSQFYDLLVTNHDLDLKENIPEITFSGGVADVLDEQFPLHPFQYGDIGLLLGHKLRQSRIYKEKNILTSAETIRATVVGAGSHTAEVSGSTISYQKNALPVQNIPILKLSQDDEIVSSQEMASIIHSKTEWFDVESQLSQVALAINGKVNPSFLDIQRYAKGIVSGLNKLIEKNIPIIIVVYEDMAKALGHSIFQLLPKDYPYICLDSIKVENGDYIDIGLPLAEGAVLPVIVKTLVFN